MKKKQITTPQSLNSYIKSICDIMRRSGRAGALQYVPELTWMLFLRILDEKEQREEEQARAVGVSFSPSLEYPYRWQDWAAPDGEKRNQLQIGALGGFMSFVDGELLPFLRKLKEKPGATPRQRVISEVFSYTEKTGIDTERNLLDILDRIHELSLPTVEETHMFTLSQVYELTNPPFGGKEGKEAQTSFAYKTRATQVLFLQHVIDSLKPGGRCGIVMDEGVLFRTNEKAFVQTKRKLLNECNLFCILSLPPKVFVNAGAASKTNLLFFKKGEPTKEIWYYDLSDIKVTKKQLLYMQHFDEFFKLLPQREESENSWKVLIEKIQEKNYDIKAVNPNRKIEEDTRTPEELISIIDSQNREIDNILSILKDKGI